MVIRFRTRELQTIANDAKKARKLLGQRSTDVLRRRLDDLRASANLETMRHLPGRCHELKGNRGGQLAIDLEHPKRLIFVPLDSKSRVDGGLDWPSITEIEIVEIIDYH